MYEVVLLTADYEGWFFFDDWQDHVKEHFIFDTFKDMERKYVELCDILNQKYSLKRVGKYNVTTFYNTCDIQYCDDCDDDVQIYHTPLMLINSKIYEYHVKYENLLK